jgi:hypothetical protein
MQRTSTMLFQLASKTNATSTRQKSLVYWVDPNEDCSMVEIEKVFILYRATVVLNFEIGGSNLNHRGDSFGTRRDNVLLIYTVGNIQLYSLTRGDIQD